MREAKHTPKPWRVVEGQGMRGPTIDIADARNRCVARCRAANESIPESEARANAGLIAAAPDLLAALKQNLSSLAECSIKYGYTYRQAYEDALAAVAKAEGQA